MKRLGTWTIVLLICVGIMFTAGATSNPVQAFNPANCEILILPTSSGYVTPGGRIILIRKPKPTGRVSWQDALASGIDSSGLTTAHFHDIALSQVTIIAAGRAMERQKVGHNVAAWASAICRARQISGSVPQWLFYQQSRTLDLYESLRPE